MKLVIQRVSRASVTVRGSVIGQIGQGYLVLVGVGREDTKEDADRLVRKMIGLRIFSDENGKINKSLKDEMCIRDRRRKAGGYQGRV